MMCAFVTVLHTYFTICYDTKIKEPYYVIYKQPSSSSTSKPSASTLVENHNTSFPNILVEGLPPSGSPDGNDGANDCNKTNFVYDSLVPKAYQFSTKAYTKLKYNGSTIDRGHMVPNADYACSTYIMTNVVPQLSNFNRGKWKVIEKMIRSYVGYNIYKSSERSWVYTENGIMIPTGFYWVVYDDKKEIKTYGYINQFTGVQIKKLDPNFSLIFNEALNLNDVLNANTSLIKYRGIDWLAIGVVMLCILMAMTAICMIR